MPDDDEIEEMDPVMKMWMFYSWIEDNNEQVDLLKHTGYLIGSFIDPQAARQLSNSNKTSVDDEAFEQQAKKIEEEGKKVRQEIKTGKRKRKRKVS